MLQLVRNSHRKTGVEVVWDANDVLSAVPRAKNNTREPTPDEKKKGWKGYTFKSRGVIEK